MPMTWRFDLVEGSGVRRSVGLLEITRIAHVSGIPIEEGETGTDSEVLLKVLADSGFPGFLSEFETENDDFKGATLQDATIQSRPHRTNSVMMRLVYRKRIGDEFVLEVTRQISFVQAYSTAEGTNNIQVWYKQGTDTSTYEPPEGADIKNVAVPRMRVNRVLRAKAIMSYDQWTIARNDFEALAGRINSDIWGADGRGVWFFVGPETRTEDRGRSYEVILTFLENKYRWYSVSAYMNYAGRHPQDCATERDVGVGFSPPEYDSVTAMNGISLSSDYKEGSFSPVFNFTPEDA